MSIESERCCFTTPRDERTSIGILESFTVEDEDTDGPR